MSAVLARDAGVAGAARTSAAGTGAAGSNRASAIVHVGLAELGTLTPTGRPGGQGRVYRPEHAPACLVAAPVVVKLYRRPPPASAVGVLRDMIAWSHGLPEAECARLHGLTAWPLAIVSGVRDVPAGIVMRDLTARFAVPFTMPSGRRQDVLLSLEHLLGDDGYLLARGLDVATGTVIRLRVAERISRALGFLHDRAIVVGDIAPNNLLVSFGRLGPPVSFIDCDSMVFGGRQALPTVQTTDWQLPRELGEAPGTRAADAYKLGLIVLRLLARCHDARTLAPHRRHVPEELRELLTRALGPEPALRPAAGEWQRALEVASVRPGIGALHPGPVLRARVRPVTATVTASSGWPGSNTAVPPAPPRPPRPHAGTRRRSARRGMSTLALAWVAIGAILLTLLLARLFAAAIPVSPTPQFGSGNGGGAPGSGFYVVPGGGGGPGRGLP